MKKFKVKNKKNKLMIGSVIVVILLLSITLLIRTFAIYKETDELNVIKGMIPYEFYDTMVTFYQEDEKGNKTPISIIPEGKNWDVTVTCDKGANGSWDTLNWGPSVSNLTESITKCRITFAPLKGLALYGIKDPIVNIGEGIYEVTHKDAVIGTHMNATETENLQMTEYRYAGLNPKNYVLFNNELWRMIGLVNTPEGSRIKIIRQNSIGKKAWDVTNKNNWATGSLQTELNTTYLNNIETTSKTFIDTISWNIGGSENYSTASNGTSKHYYNYERGNNVWKDNSSIWQGKIGIMNVSDYGYATSGGSTKSRLECLEKELYNWADSAVSDCKNNDWLYLNPEIRWTMNTIPSTSISTISMGSYGDVGGDQAVYARDVLPSLYLLSNIKIKSGDGTSTLPYLLAI